MPQPARSISVPPLMAVAFLLLLAAYSNHFGNSFHFDDIHTIVDNPSIRSWSNLPRLLTDGSAFSVHPQNQTWRPVVSVSLAFDYWLGGGLNPVWFHVSTFAWFLVLLLTVAVIYDRAAGTAGRRLALCACAVLAVHPVVAETLNYIIQRGDLYATLGCVAALATYILLPSRRGIGLYLVPFVLGALAKPTALVFPLLLAAWVMIVENARPSAALRATLPSLVVALLLGLLHHSMTPASFQYGAPSAYRYVITQPFVALQTFATFFCPTRLSADTDWTPFTSMVVPAALAGLCFLAGFLALMGWSWRMGDRPVAFGLCWFVLAWLPAAVTPVAEVTNDHRMFFPFIGLVLAMVSKVGRCVPARVQAPVAVVVLSVLAVATFHRNAVWHTEATLWADVVQQSPRNGRAWVNNGLSRLATGDVAGALDCFHTAQHLTPNYPTLEMNLGIAEAELQHNTLAEAHFRRAMALDRQSAESCFYYARWLNQVERTPECVYWLQRAIDVNPRYMNSRWMLLDIDIAQHRWGQAEALASDTLRVAPNDPASLAAGVRVRSEASHAIEGAQQAVRQKPSSGTWLKVWLAYFQAGQYSNSIEAARHAIVLDPGSAIAYGDLAAGYIGLHAWTEAIDAAQRALQLDPTLITARQNLDYARHQLATPAR